MLTRLRTASGHYTGDHHASPFSYPNVMSVRVTGRNLYPPYNYRRTLTTFDFGTIKRSETMHDWLTNH
jgi:hypothetical protein